MSRLNDEEKAAVKQAASEAETYQRALAERETEAIREALVDSGMLMTRPDKASFIEVAQGVQDEIAAERGEEFQDLVQRIRAAAP